LIADTVLLCIQPGSGDSLQFMKAGVMELPDVIVVTKADMGAPRAGAPKPMSKGALTLFAPRRRRLERPPVVSSQRRTGRRARRAGGRARRPSRAGSTRKAVRAAAAPRRNRTWVDEAIRTRFGTAKASPWPRACRPRIPALSAGKSNWVARWRDGFTAPEPALSPSAAACGR
jgi:LAO/AO transport system kinase